MNVIAIKDYEPDNEKSSCKPVKHRRCEIKDDRKESISKIHFLGVTSGHNLFTIEIQLLIDNNL